MSNYLFGTIATTDFNWDNLQAHSRSTGPYHAHSNRHTKWSCSVRRIIWSNLSGYWPWNVAEICDSSFCCTIPFGTSKRIMAVSLDATPISVGFTKMD